MTAPDFPPGFRWGSATSAYQVEGGWDADGKVPSIRDTHQHGALVTPDGTSGDIAIDQYARLDGDLDLLEQLGASTHRFPVSWSRVMTDASGSVNAPGLDYYERMVDGLLDRGLRPALCLFHWDTPQWLEDRGGMMTREFADHFAELSSAVAERLGDRVAEWYTLNEPANPSVGGYMAGFLPPKRMLGTAGMSSVHHLLLAHGRAVQALRSHGVDGTIGTIVSINGFAPATTHPDDVVAARRAEYFEGRLFLDPLLGRGHLPEVALSLADTVHEGDLALIAQPLDHLGVNWKPQYSAVAPGRAAPHLLELPRRGAVSVLAPLTAPLGFIMVPTPGAQWGGRHRHVTPGGFRSVLDWVGTTYPDHPDIVITENGVGGIEEPASDGSVQDRARIEYLTWTLEELAGAISDGARVVGYHLSSSFDDVHRMSGFSQRHGSVFVDPTTLDRTAKSSYDWYRSVVTLGDHEHDAVAEPAGDHRGIDVAGVRNARGIGGLRTVDGRRVRDGLIFRSAALHELDEDGRRELDRLRVTKILDLRSEAELEQWPSPLPQLVEHLPLHTLSTDTKAMPPLDDVYARIVDEKGAAIVGGIRSIVNHCDGAVLVHCTGGKDRTGVFIALLLAAIGVCDEDIVTTYAESAARLGDDFTRDVIAQLANAEVPAEALAAVGNSDASHIVLALARVRHRHGTVAAYLEHSGLQREELTLLRSHLLAEAGESLSPRGNERLC